MAHNKSRIIYVIISKLYKVQAMTDKEEYAIEFAKLIGGKKNCYIIKTPYDKIELGTDTINNNMIFEWNGIYLTQQLDMELTEFLELKHGDMSGCMHQMMDLLTYYKFTDEEQSIVNRFVEVYNYYFVRDIHGFTEYDINEEVNYKLLIKMYLNTIKRNKKVT